jgi:hypothetical protein
LAEFEKLQKELNEGKQWNQRKLKIFNIKVDQARNV